MKVMKDFSSRKPAVWLVLSVLAKSNVDMCWVD
ncbi:hypothetical protein FHS19_001130 [Paenibacillus rhizosphaerae]|uniref:Uncharacterized protein n=1 Tax=Paenibacillus rhizosphaerae TaxID=297318 RepID=A0A839TI41_9BACL|nr:hypothetical protein [Paenibacillus rhizosphaerae]